MLSFIVIFVYIYLIYGLYNVYHKMLSYRVYLVILLGALLKMLYDYRVCSIAYLECKVRGIPRDYSYMNNLLDPIIDLRYTNHIYPIYIIGCIILYYNIYWYLKIFKV